MKVSSVKRSRIRTNFVDRKITVGKTDAVESISSISGMKNSSYNSSENQLLFYEQFYDNLKELHKEYKKFYHDEQILEDAIENFDKNRDKLLSNMKELIIKYNNAVKSLASFDKAFDTNHVIKIQDILVEYRRKLENLGIYITNHKELNLNETVFIDKIQSNENALDFLFEPTKGIILKIYAIFRNIKISKKNAIERKYNNSTYKGLILDDKS